MNNNPNVVQTVVKLLKEKPMDCHELSIIFSQYNTAYINDVLRKLYLAGDIYICKWKLNPGFRNLTKVYTYGIGRDMPKPDKWYVAEPIDDTLVRESLLKKLKESRNKGDDNLFTPLLFLSTDSVLNAVK